MNQRTGRATRSGPRGPRAGRDGRGSADLPPDRGPDRERHHRRQPGRGGAGPLDQRAGRVPPDQPGHRGQGLNQLVDDGILYKKRGIGMFVSAGARAKLRQRRRDQFSDQYLRPLLVEAHKLGLRRRRPQRHDRRLGEGPMNPVLAPTMCPKCTAGRWSDARRPSRSTMSASPSRSRPSTGCSAATAPARPRSCRSSPGRTSPAPAGSNCSAQAPYENDAVLAQVCFVKESQRYPDVFTVANALRAAARLFPQLGQRLRTVPCGGLPAAGPPAGQQALPRHAVRARRHHRPGRPVADHPLRRALPRPRRGGPAAVLRPAAARLRRPPAHGHPVHPPHRRGQRR